MDSGSDTVPRNQLFERAMDLIEDDFEAADRQAAERFEEARRAVLAQEQCIQQHVTPYPNPPHLLHRCYLFNSKLLTSQETQAAISLHLLPKTGKVSKRSIIGNGCWTFPRINIEPIPSYRIRLRLPSNLFSKLLAQSHNSEGHVFPEIPAGFNFMCDFVVWPITRTYGDDLSAHIIAKSKNAALLSNALNEPRGIAIHPTTGLIYVVDTVGNRIHILNSSLETVNRFGRLGNGSGEFVSPYGIAFSADGLVMAVTEHQNHRVQLFDGKEHNPIRVIGGGQSHLPGRFDRPAYITFDHDENFYVADTNNERVQKFSKAGTFVCVIGKDSLWPPVGKVFGLVVNDSNELLTIPKTGDSVRAYSTDGRFLYETPVKETGLSNFLGRGPNGGFVLTSARHERMWTYGPSGCLVSETSFHGPSGAVFDRDGRLFVSLSALGQIVSV